MDYVLGKNEYGRKVIYAVTDKIDATPLEQAVASEEKRQMAIDEVEKTFLSIIRYLDDKYNENGSFLWDITKPDQYVYGKKQGDAEEHMYLVDIEPLLEPANNPIFTAPDPFLWSISKLMAHIIRVEQKIGIELSRVRDSLFVFLKKFPPKKEVIYKDKFETLERLIKKSTNKPKE